MSQGETKQRILIIASLLLLGACSVEPGSETWCAQKKEQPKSEWSGSDAVTFARNCLLDGSAVGSKGWCEDLSEKPKGEWTAEETASYAKHCIIQLAVLASLTWASVLTKISSSEKINRENLTLRARSKSKQANNIKTVAPDATLIEFCSYDEGMAMLNNGEADAIVADLTRSLDDWVATLP